MADGARINSVEVLMAFRAALVKFQESANTAIGDAESDIHSTVRWLENDQFSYWNTQIRLRQEALGRAQEALRQKTIFKDSAGRTPSAVEEQKEVNKCKMRLDEAQQKLQATKMWAKRLQKEGLLYKGQMQRIQTSVTIDVPAAYAHLGQLITALQEYFAMQSRGETPTIDPALAAYFGGEAGVASMSRGQAPEDKKEEAPAEEKKAEEKKAGDEPPPAGAPVPA